MYYAVMKRHSDATKLGDDETTRKKRKEKKERSEERSERRGRRETDRLSPLRVHTRPMTARECRFTAKLSAR